MAIAEPTINNTTKYYITDSELQLLADAIRAEGGTSALLTYPDGFISAINNLSSVKNSNIARAWPNDFNQLYWTTETELQSIANAIRNKIDDSELLTYLEDFINNLTNFSKMRVLGTLNVDTIEQSDKISIYITQDSASNFYELLYNSLGSGNIRGTNIVFSFSPNCSMTFPQVQFVNNVFQWFTNQSVVQIRPVSGYAQISLSELPVNFNNWNEQKITLLYPY